MPSLLIFARWVLCLWVQQFVKCISIHHTVVLAFIYFILVSNPSFLQGVHDGLLPPFQLTSILGGMRWKNYCLVSPSQLPDREENDHCGWTLALQTMDIPHLCCPVSSITQAQYIMFCYVSGNSQVWKQVTMVKSGLFDVGESMATILAPDTQSASDLDWISKYSLLSSDNQYLGVVRSFTEVFQDGLHTLC